MRKILSLLIILNSFLVCSQKKHTTKYEKKKIENFSKLLNGEWSFIGFKNINSNDFEKNELNKYNKIYENKSEKLTLKLNLTEKGFFIKKYLNNNLVLNEKSNNWNLIFKIQKNGTGTMNEIMAILNEKEKSFIDLKDNNHKVKVQIIRNGRNYLLKCQGRYSEWIYILKIKKSKLIISELSKDSKHLKKTYEKN